MLRDFVNKIKAFSGTRREEMLISFIILLVALLAFGLGRLSVLYGGEGEFEILYPSEQAGAVLGASSFQLSGSGFQISEKLKAESQQLTASSYVASKTGAKYHLPWCSGAQRIKEENKIYFETKAEAEAAGYTAAGNCKGL